jgi:hypothetical protein
VVSISALTGTTTWAGGDAAGTMRLRSAFHAVTGTPTWTSGENWKVAAGTNDGTLTSVPKIVARQDKDLLFPWKQPAKCALVTVLTNTALVAIDGSTPDQTALVGFPMKDGSSILLRDMESIINFKVIDYVASSASVVNVEFFF